MNVKIEVGKPVRMEADSVGPAYHVYPVTVRGEGKGVRRLTLSANESQIAEAPGGNLVHQVSERDLAAGTHELFASVWDGTETKTTTTQLQTTKAAATAPKPEAPPPGSPPAQK